MFMPTIEIALPGWMETDLRRSDRTWATVAGRMARVIELARRNVGEGTGGPFAAAVFEMDSGRLVAAGVNRVMATNCSVAHAEILAIMAAQKIVGSYDLGGEGMPAMELVCSTEPCCMCLGAVVWSGVRRLVCGARDTDARRIGFDEGPKPDDWVGDLESRGIDVMRDVARRKAVSVLNDYVDRGGVVYNARQGGNPAAPDQH